jgi:hypothetical protein
VVSCQAVVSIFYDSPIFKGLIVPEKVGGWVMPAAPEKDHTAVSRYLASEIFRRWLRHEKVVVNEWTKSVMSHCLGMAEMACMVAKGFGWRISDTFLGFVRLPR